MDVASYVATLPLARSTGFDHYLYWDFWCHRWSKFNFNSLLDLCKKIREDFAKIIVYIQNGSFSYYLVNSFGTVKKIEIINCDFIVRGKPVSLSSVIKNSVSKFIPTYQKVVSHPNPNIVANYEFNKFKSPIKIKRKNGNADISSLQYYIYEVLANKNPLIETKIYDFIRGILTNQPIRQALFLYNSTDQQKEPFFRLLTYLLYANRIQEMGESDILTDISEDTVLLRLHPSFDSWKELRTFISEPHIHNHKFANLRNVVMICEDYLDDIIYKYRNYYHLNFIKVCNRSFKKRFWAKLHINIEDPAILSQFIDFVLNRPEGLKEIQPELSKQALEQINNIKTFLNSTQITDINEIFYKYRSWCISRPDQDKYIPRHKFKEYLLQI
nr:hypothetical protein [Abalone asfa-like virus]